MDAKIYAQGFMTFCFTKDGISMTTRTLEELSNQKELLDTMYLDRLVVHLYDMMSGDEFLEAVDGGGFIDYDGTLACILVDGFKTNLGLNHKGIHQGDFQVDGEVFKKLCREHKVLVNWANK